LQYVYLDEGEIIKQIVDVGDQNENFVLIRKGLNEGNKILLNKPENAEALAFEGMDIYEEIKARRIREAEEERSRIEEEKNQPFNLQKKQSNGNSGVIIIG